MENIMTYNRHYIVVDELGRITAGWSDGPHPHRDTTGAILLTDRGGYQFRLFPNGEENPELRELNGVPMYKWDGVQVIRRSEDEMEVEHPAPPPTEEEVRAKRDKMLAETDWTQVLDAPIDAETRKAYRIYRQALRNITEQEGFPSNVVWPELPAVAKADPDPVDEAVDVLLEV